MLNFNKLSKWQKLFHFLNDCICHNILRNINIQSYTMIQWLPWNRILSSQCSPFPPRVDPVWSIKCKKKSEKSITPKYYFYFIAFQHKPLEVCTIVFVTETEMFSVFIALELRKLEKWLGHIFVFTSGEGTAAKTGLIAAHHKLNSYFVFTLQHVYKN